MVWLRCVIGVALFCWGSLAAMSPITASARSAAWGLLPPELGVRSDELQLQAEIDKLINEIHFYKALFVMIAHHLAKIKFDDKACATPILGWDELHDRYRLVFRDPLYIAEPKYSCSGLNSDRAIALLAAALSGLEQTRIEAKMKVSRLPKLAVVRSVIWREMAVHLFNAHQMLINVSWLTPSEDRLYALPCCGDEMKSFAGPDGCDDQQENARRKQYETEQACLTADTVDEDVRNPCRCGKTLNELLGDDLADFTDEQEDDFIKRLASPECITVYLARVKLMLNRLLKLRFLSLPLRSFVKDAKSFRRRIFKTVGEQVITSWRFEPAGLDKCLTACVRVLARYDEFAERAVEQGKLVLDLMLNELLPKINAPIFSPQICPNEVMTTS